jgi:serine/threonine protein kinase
MMRSGDDYNKSAKNSQGPLIAIKRLISRKSVDFEKERDMISSLTMKGHPHLVKLLWTYRLNGRYHFLCPFAKANLRDFWKARTLATNDQDTHLWALQQIEGLVSGLNVIHNFKTPHPLESDEETKFSRNRPTLKIRMAVDPKDEKYGRHGDLKPENILWFNDLQGVDDAGVLQISDFGLGRFHRLESRSRQDPRTINGSPTYIPPELALERPVSRAYDIWSLGCILLEFITWLLEGQEGLDNFADARTAKAHDGIFDDTYYTLSVSKISKEGEVRPGVSTWMKRLRREHHCSQMVLELLDVVQTRMLKVNPEERVKAEELKLLMEAMLERGRRDYQYLLASEGYSRV